MFLNIRSQRATAEQLEAGVFDTSQPQLLGELLSSPETASKIAKLVQLVHGYPNKAVLIDGSNESLLSTALIAEGYKVICTIRK